MMGSLLPLGLSLAPELAQWIGDENAGPTIEAVSQAIQTATGTADLEAAAVALQKDPATSAALRVRLAQIAAACRTVAQAAEFDRLASALRDSARAGGGSASQKAVTAWSAPVVSAVVLVIFGVVMVLVLRYGMPTGSETAANMLLGTLAAMATSIVSYWVGSSAGSARKDDRIAQAGQAAK